MKKLLSFALVLAMVLGCVSMAFAGGVSYSDTKGIKEEEAINVLSGLGVLAGYPDGSFKPTANVKRAEMVKMICAALNLPIAEGAYTTKFTEDVAPNAWYSAYVYYATELGIVKGKTDTSFDPEGFVKYDEAIAMVMRALGYTDDCLNGVYPSSYVNKAVGLGALKGVLSGSGFATRAHCAQLIYNVLDMKIGKVTDGVWVASTGNSAVGKDEDAEYDSMLKRLGLGKGEDLIVTEGVVEDEASLVDLSAYLGKKVSVYRNDDDEIIAVAKVLSTELVGKYNGTDKIADTKFAPAVKSPASKAHAAYSFADDKAVKDKDVEGKDGLMYLLNNEDKENETDFGFKNNTKYTWNVVLENGKIKDVISVVKWEVTAAGVVTEDDLDDMLEEGKYELFTAQLPTNDDDELEAEKIVLNGVASLEDIEEGNVVYIYEDSDNTVVRMDVGTEVVEGNVNRVSTATGKPTVEGTTYSLAYEKGDEGYFHNTDDFPVATKEKMLEWKKAGKDGKLVLDYEGKVYTADFDEKTTSNYVVLLKYQEAQEGIKSSIDGSVAKIQVFNAEGEAVVYELDSDVKYNTTTKGAASVSEIANLFDVKGNGDGKVAEIEINSKDKVTKVVYKALTDKTKKIDKSGNVDETTVLDGSTILFKYNDSKDAFKAAAWSVATTKSIFGTTPKKLEVLKDGKTTKVAVATDGTKKTDNYDVILKASYEIKDDKYEVEVIDGTDLDAVYTSKKGLNPVVYNDKVDAEKYAKKYTVLYTIELSKDGVIEKSEPWVEDNAKGTKKVEVTLATDKATSFVNDNVLETKNGTYTVDEEIVVYVYNLDTKKWSLGKFSDLKGIKAEKNVVSLTLYDTVEEKNDPEFFYNVAIMVIEK